MIALLARLFLHSTKDEEAVRHGYGMICGCVGIVMLTVLVRWMAVGCCS